MRRQTPTKFSILCGPIAPKNGVSRGGYETANRRTINLLGTSGYSVEEYAYPDTLGKGVFSRAMSYAINFRALKRKLKNRDVESFAVPFHITPLFKQFILPEYLLIRQAKRLGMRIVLDLRAGNKARDYARFGSTYRSLFKRCVDFADIVSVEGREYIPFVHSINPGVKVVYLPNFVDKENIATEQPQRSTDICRLVYVGTVSEAKGVPDVIRVADHLAETGLPVHLDIVGRPIKSYQNDFDEACNKRPHVTAHGPQSFDFVRSILDESHFFIFLTKWSGEGHSNALTEAMARGCVPIATDHGFNRSTISDCGSITNNRSDAAEISLQIAQLFATSSLKLLSEASLKRIQIQFSSETVLSVFDELYQRDRQD